MDHSTVMTIRMMMMTVISSVFSTSVTMTKYLVQKIKDTVYQSRDSFAALARSDSISTHYFLLFLQAKTQARK